MSKLEIQNFRGLKYLFVCIISLHYYCCHFREFLIGFNYTSDDWSVGIWSLFLSKALGAVDDGVNVTSRYTMFNDPSDPTSKVR